MKTLLQINTVVDYGSTGRIAEEIGQVAIENGWESYIAFGRKERPSASKLIKIGNKWDLYFHVLQTRLFDNHGFASSRATKKLINQIKRVNPDVIHLHNLHGYYLHVELLFTHLKKMNKPIIWTLHDCWVFTGHCTYYDLISCDRWKRVCYDCPLKTAYPKSLLFDRSRRNYKRKKKLFTGIRDLTIVVPSQWLADQVYESFLQDYSVEVIHNGIDLSEFQPTFSNFRQRHKLENWFVLLGVAAQWDERKGWDDFLNLSTFLKEDEKIVLVGVDNKQIRSLPPQIIGIAKTNNIKELAEIYSMADIFVNPTHEDNFPTTNLESLACGTPVITYKSGGSPECLDSSCGLVVERGDLSALVEAVAAIRKNGKESYTANGLKRTRNLFDKDVQFVKYIDLYKKML